MKSIRLSLIVYFLVLLTASLGAVSWFSYQTSAQALRDRQSDAHKMIVEQCDTRSQALLADLDRRILRQAQMMASIVSAGKDARPTLWNTEGLAPFGAIGSAVLPHGYFSIPVWMSQGTYLPWLPEGKYPMLAREIYVNQPVRFHIEPADDLIPVPDNEHGQEYFQTFRPNGYSLQRSKSMGEHSFVLDEDARDRAVQLTESFRVDDPVRVKAGMCSGAFDVVELTPGIKVRRITLKATVAPRLLRYEALPWPWMGPPHGPMARPKFGPPPKGSGFFPKGTVRLGGHEALAPSVYIQYASDLDPVEEKVREYQCERDQQLTQLETTVDNDLRQLRGRMLWIALGTLAAIWIGGFALIHVGLKPLSKLSDAVGRVSPRDFRLPLDSAKLPQELRPIAQTLTATLDQLRQAFEREKHAAADISHELRTPLAALMTTLEVGLRKTRSPEEYREILQDCHASGRHMYQLVERLLALARLDAGADLYRPVLVDAVDLALECADIVRPLAKARSLELRVHLPDPVTLHTDPNKLREVLINLLHNAVEYNKANGSIELAVECIRGHVRIEVRDTGIGISPEALGHIFERFYRADPSRHADTPHAGLGLAIVKSYIDLMGGTIGVVSSSAGTTFTIELPGSPAGAEAQTGIQAPSAMSTR